MQKTKTRDMTKGSILRQLIAFALPMMLGNVFQLLYSTVDTIVVGNFVTTEALAAVGSTAMITNTFVFFFGGLAVGSSVVIGNCFGAKKYEQMHRTIETTMTLTFIFSIVMTFAGIALVKPMLRLMATPEDVMASASSYLTIYMAGVSGVMIYNSATGILNAVGDSTRPLYLLILTSILNIILDLLFVLKFKLGVEGVAYATIIAQFVSAFLVMTLLLRTKEVYRFTWHDMKIHKNILLQVISIGLPTALMNVVTSFSNVFVQSYINSFGSTAMAGWSCYNKLDQFVLLPMSSMSNAAMTFVSQNIGAGNEKRANKGTFLSVATIVVTIFTIATVLYNFSDQANALFTKDSSVIAMSSLFIRTNIYFLILNCVNHTLAGSLRGRADTTVPMLIMVTCYVVLRQIYLYVVTHFISNTPVSVALSYPIGWISCTILLCSYFYFKWLRKPRSV